MTFTPQALNCPNCGGALEKFHPRSKTLCCPFCTAYIEVRRGEATLQEVVKQPNLRLVLNIGQEGTIDGETVRVVGHIRYGTGRYTWDEFLILSEGGRTLWLSVDEGEASLLESFTPSEEIDPASIKSSLRIDGQNVYVKERGRAHIVAIAGELTWAARKGEEISYIDAGNYSIEFSEREIEFYRVRPIEWYQLEQAFGHLNFIPVHTDEDDWEAAGSQLFAGGGANVPGVAAIIILVVFFILIVVAIQSCGVATSSGFSSGGHYSSSRSSFGGGK